MCCNSLFSIFTLMKKNMYFAMLLFKHSQCMQKLYLNMMYVGIDQVTGLSNFVQGFLSLSKVL